MKQVKRRHSPEFKQEVLKLAQRITTAKAVNHHACVNLHLVYSHDADFTEVERDRYLATGNARLKRELAGQKEELAILKKGVYLI